MLDKVFGRKIDMCKAMTMIKEENYNMGKSEGIIEGKKEERDKALESVTTSLIEDNNISEEEARKQALHLLRRD